MFWHGSALPGMAWSHCAPHRAPEARVVSIWVNHLKLAVIESGQCLWDEWLSLLLCLLQDRISLLPRPWGVGAPTLWLLSALAVLFLHHPQQPDVLWPPVQHPRGDPCLSATPSSRVSPLTSDMDSCLTAQRALCHADACLLIDTLAKLRAEPVFAIKTLIYVNQMRLSIG